MLTEKAYYSKEEFEEESKRQRSLRHKRLNLRYAISNGLRDYPLHTVQTYRFCCYCQLEKGCPIKHKVWNFCARGVWKVLCPGCGREYTTVAKECSHCGASLALKEGAKE